MPSILSDNQPQMNNNPASTVRNIVDQIMNSSNPLPKDISPRPLSAAGISWIRSAKQFRNPQKRASGSR